MKEKNLIPKDLIVVDSIKEYFHWYYVYDHKECTKLLFIPTILEGKYLKLNKNPKYKRKYNCATTKDVHILKPEYEYMFQRQIEKLKEHGLYIPQMGGVISDLKNSKKLPLKYRPTIHEVPNAFKKGYKSHYELIRIKFEEQIISFLEQKYPKNKTLQGVTIQRVVSLFKDLAAHDKGLTLKEYIQKMLDEVCLPTLLGSK